MSRVNKWPIPDQSRYHFLAVMCAWPHWEAVAACEGVMRAREERRRAA